MPNEPDPVPTGTTGTVVSVVRVETGREAWLQVDVDWDNQRQLMISVPPDQFEFLSRDAEPDVHS